MPNIKEYIAPKETLTQPAEGEQAWTMAGRRIGPLYNEAATFEKEAGKLQAEGLKEGLWPYNILKLYEEQNKAAAGGGARGGGGGGRARVDTSGIDRILRPDQMPDLAAENAAANRELGYGLSAVGNMLGSNAGRGIMPGGGGQAMMQDDQGNLVPVPSQSALDRAQAQADAAQAKADAAWSNTVPNQSSIPGQDNTYGPNQAPGYNIPNPSNAPEGYPVEPASSGFFSGLTSAPAVTDAGGDMAGTTSTGM
jgi:hypothetical protein